MLGVEEDQNSFVVLNIKKGSEESSQILGIDTVAF